MMKFLILFTFILTILNASLFGCEFDTKLDHCSPEHEVISDDCHSESEESSDHNKDCSCGCHFHSSHLVINYERALSPSFVIKLKKEKILNHYLLQLRNFQNQIIRPPIYTS